MTVQPQSKQGELSPGLDERIEAIMSILMVNDPPPIGYRRTAEAIADRAGLPSLLSELADAREEIERLRVAQAAARVLIREIAGHRNLIRNAGMVRVDSRDEEVAEAKHRADQQLWRVLDPGWLPGGLRVRSTG